MSEKTASELCGISESTANEWKKDPTFRSAVLQARAKGKEWWVSKLKGHADKQVGAVMFWLSRRTEEFQEHQEHVPDDQIQRLAALLGGALVSSPEASAGTPGNTQVSE